MCCHQKDALKSEGEVDLPTLDGTEVDTASGPPVDGVVTTDNDMPSAPRAEDLVAAEVDAASVPSVDDHVAVAVDTASVPPAVDDLVDTTADAASAPPVDELVAADDESATSKTSKQSWFGKKKGTSSNIVELDIVSSQQVMDDITAVSASDSDKDNASTASAEHRQDVNVQTTNKNSEEADEPTLFGLPRLLLAVVRKASLEKAKREAAGDNEETVDVETVAEVDVSWGVRVATH